MISIFEKQQFHLIVLLLEFPGEIQTFQIHFCNSTKIFKNKIANDIKNSSKIELNDDDIDDNDDDNNLIEKSETVVKKPKPRRKTKRQSPGARILSIFKERVAEETKPKIKFCRSTILKLGNIFFYVFASSNFNLVFLLIIFHVNIFFYQI